MGNIPKPSDDKHTSPDITGVSMGLIFIDTTWRLAVPSIGLTLLGVWLDQELTTKPWLMIIGAITGVALGMYLVYLQIKRTTTKKEY